MTAIIAATPQRIARVLPLLAAVCRKEPRPGDRKSTRLNSSHQIISYAVFCLKKKNIQARDNQLSAPQSAAALVRRGYSAAAGDTHSGVSHHTGDKPLPQHHAAVSHPHAFINL